MLVGSEMVSQVICVICSVLPEPKTTDITFYKFPNAIESPAKYKIWKNAFVDALSEERPEILNDAHLSDSYICSRHFTATDFVFENGKLVLMTNAVPSRIAKSVYEGNDTDQSNKITKEYEPSSRGNNFATTVTNNFVTTSRNNRHSDLVCTETSRALTPSVSEFIMSSTAITYDIGDKASLVNTRKRNVELEHKVESFEKIFKCMRSDNLLTENYVQKLKVSDFIDIVSEISGNISFFNRLFCRIICQKQKKS